MANYFSCEGFTRRGHPGTKRLLAQRQIVKKFTILYELRDQQKTFVLMLLSESQNENDEIDGVGEVCEETSKAFCESTLMVSVIKSLLDAI